MPASARDDTPDWGKCPNNMGPKMINKWIQNGSETKPTNTTVVGVLVHTTHTYTWSPSLARFHYIRVFMYFTFIPVLPTLLENFQRKKYLHSQNDIDFT